MNEPTRHDPIRRLYDWLERSDSISDWIFYIVAALSVLVLLVDRALYPNAYNFMLTLFVVGVVTIFSLGAIGRLYLAPRAEDRRRQDFLATAFQLETKFERTQGYYNNALNSPHERIAAQILENSFFTKNLLRHVAVSARIKTGGYAAVLLAIVLTQKVDVGIIAAMSQVVFSEQVVSRWLRVEWFRSRCERIYDAAYRVLKSPRSGADFGAAAVEVFGMYETGKSVAGITIPNSLFDKLNPALSKDWETIRADLKL